MSYASLRKWLAVSAGVAVCLGLATAVRAADFNFTQGDSHYLGVVIPDGNNPTIETGEVNILAGMAPGDTQTITNPPPEKNQFYRRSVQTLCFNSCPAADVNQSTDAGGNTGTLDGNQLYVMGKYDNTKAGMYVWYVAGLVGTYTIPLNLGTCGSMGCGLSHSIVWGGTTGGGTGGNETGGGTGGNETGPEPASLLLFGAALSAAGLRLRRRVRQS